MFPKLWATTLQWVATCLLVGCDTETDRQLARKMYCSSKGCIQLQWKRLQSSRTSNQLVCTLVQKMHKTWISWIKSLFHGNNLFTLMNYCFFTLQILIWVVKLTIKLCYSSSVESVYNTI